MAGDAYGTERDAMGRAVEETPMEMPRTTPGTVSGEFPAGSDPGTKVRGAGVHASEPENPEEGDDRGGGYAQASGDAQSEEDTRR